MIEHLLLKKYKGLPETSLAGLKKINVICGKNNTGKSTLIQAINDNTIRIIGRIFSEEDKLVLYHAIKDWINVTRSDGGNDEGKILSCIS
ncbi:MAG TPA: hypothetical protein VFJ29_07015, partial [Candidatus Kapabacteria bacterium]|nr:hypothetical protein [Candidatus Kapabacteria bacterium]